MNSSASEQQLIFDLGFHKGEDTHYYLASGHKVVAVEADPTLFEMGLEQFKDAIDSGVLHLIYGAVLGSSRNIREISFYPHPTNSEWGTTNLDWMKRNEKAFGMPHDKEISVPVITLPYLAKKFGCPHYVKIDIEGADAEVLADLSNLELKPAFVSWETGKESFISVIKQHLDLRKLGYTRFRIVQQEFQHLKIRTTLPDGSVFSFRPSTSGPIPGGDEKNWTNIFILIFKYAYLFLIYRLIGPKSIFTRLSRVENPFLSWLPKKVKNWAGKNQIPFPGWYDSHAWNLNVKGENHKNKKHNSF